MATPTAPDISASVTTSSPVTTMAVKTTAPVTDLRLAILDLMQQAVIHVKARTSPWTVFEVGDFMRDFEEQVIVATELDSLPTLDDPEDDEFTDED